MRHLFRLLLVASRTFVILLHSLKIGNTKSNFLVQFYPLTVVSCNRDKKMLQNDFYKFTKLWAGFQWFQSIF